MALLSFRNGLGKLLGVASLGGAAALFLPHLSSSQATPPPPVAQLQPASLAVSLAHDAAPVDLTTTLTNVGGGVLSWRIGAIRDVSTESAPAVAAGPVAGAKVYARSNIERDSEAGEIIVGLKEPAAGLAARTAPTSFLGGKCRVKRELARARRANRPGRAPARLRAGRKLYLVTVEDRSKAGIQKAIEDLRKDPNVAYAEPNFRVKAIATPDDPHFDKLYGLHNGGQGGGLEDADIDAPEAWDTHTGGDNVVVGIIDTGIDYLHPDLAENIWTNPGEIAGNGIDDDANGYIDDIHGYDFVNDDPDPMDDNMHGTHVAGTIAGVGNNGIGVVGVAWKAKLAALKFLDAGGSGNLDDAIEAVAYANAMNIPITNNSWGGGGFSQALKDVIDAAGERGFLFVAAAGNASNDNDQFPSYPATYESDNILSVAATDFRDDMAFFSSFGATTVDLGAPGVDIYSCQPGGGYQYLSGTSMATPHVAGAAALLRSYNPQLGYVEIKSALLGGVDPIPSLAGKTLTGGRLNIQKALAGVSPPWLTMAPKGPGTLEAGAVQILTATVNPRGLLAGQHRALVTVVTDDPANPNRELEVVATVSGCKSLAVSPASLDFGAVWLTTARRRTLTLTNACNDYTTVTAVESSQGVFTALGALPLRVPPFGTAALEIAYAPDGLDADLGTLILRSDAQDNPALTVEASGTGVEPPSVAVDPARFELTLDPSEQASRTLTVRNTGGDVLTVDLRTAMPRAGAAARRAKAAVAGRMIPGRRVQGRSYAARMAGKPAGNLKPASLTPAFRASAADMRVLYLTTLIPGGESDQFTTGLRSLANVGYLEVQNGGSGTPDLAYLQGFDAVLVSADMPWSDPVQTGNVLADYVDNGGTVGLLVAAIAGGGGYSLQGRITLPEYMPIEMEGPGPGGEATSFADHPIMAGVTAIGCAIPTSASATRGNGLSLGTYPGGNLVGAVNPDKPVVAINVYPADFAWGGDVILMMGNVLDYLSGAASWLKVEPRSASIQPGSSADFTLSISAEGQLAGDHESAVEIAHNAPSGANPLVVPVLMHVRPVSRLALSQSKYDFGGVLVGAQSATRVTLVNSGNRATTVSGIATEGDFASGTPSPIEVPAFSSADVSIVYSPREEGGDMGGLTFHSDASDHPSLRIALRGQGLPAPLAVLEPETLTLTLAHDASPRDLTSTLSNEGRGVLAYQVTSVKDVTPARPAAKVLAIQSARIYQAANYDLPAEPGELIVGLKENQENFADAAVLGGRGIQVMGPISRARSPKGKTEAAGTAKATEAAVAAEKAAWRLPRKLMLVKLADGSKAGVQRAVEELRKDANVAFAEPNYRVKAVGIPNDPDFGLLYGLNNSGQNGGTDDADIDAPEAWDTHTGDENGVVGIIDTGIDYLHPDLAANAWINPGEIAGNGIDDDANGYIDDIHGFDFVNDDPDPMDDNMHGTHVAGTIAGVGNNGIGVVGVAWKARVAGLKFLDAGGSGNLDDAIEAVAYANAMNIPITNNSWGGGGFSQALKDVIDAAGARGFLFVAAAGNESNDNDQSPSYPATYESDNILSVAATDFRDDMAFFSSFGATTVDLGAPGVDIYSCQPGGGYQYLSGTSMATPHVAGAAALLKSYNPQLGYVEIKSALLGGVDPTPSLAGRTLTGGRLNIQKALGGVSPPWLIVSPRAPGRLQPGARQALTATVDPRGLIAGEHRGVAMITTNDPAHPVKRLEVVATVSGCRSLTATPAALDFGPVWLGASRRLAITLKNACNDFTTVNAVESSHKAFAAPGVLPLAIPPFGTVVVEIDYTPDDLKGDKATLTLKSDAEDNPVLKVAAKATGVKPPSIAVDPGRFDLTLDPSEQKSASLKVVNKGGAALEVALGIAPDRKNGSIAPAPKLIAGERKAGRRYGRFHGSITPLSIHPMVQSSAAGLKVLYLTTLAQKDSGAGDLFSQGLRALPQVAALDHLDGSIATPNADYLLGYDMVVVSADMPWADAIAVGDALAEYVDRGGRICLMVAAIASGGGFELQGRIGTPDYLPLVKEGPGMGGEASSFADHPITRGLALLKCVLPTAAAATQGGGIALGQYDNGALLGAVHADKPVVAINVFPADFAWGGDLILMMSNTLDYLSGFANWVKVEPRKLTVPAGRSLEAKLAFDTEKLEAGRYTATLTLGHNAPGGVNPLTVPISLTVKARNCLEASVASIDFGKVWTDRRGTATVELSNPCNRPTTLGSIGVNPKTFKTSATAPIEVPAFSKVAIELTYAPDDLRADRGELVLKSDAMDHPRIRIALAGTGVKPPSIAVRPASVLATLDPGVKVRKTLEISNPGGADLVVKIKVGTVEETPAKPRGKAGLIPGTPASARPLVGERRAPLAHASPRKFRAQGGQVKVLYVHTVSMFDSTGGEGADAFTRGLRALGNVASVDLVDARFQTPNLEYLQGYDVVVVGADYPFADPYLLGDALADYVDAGGKICLLSTSFYLGFPFGLEGRIAQPEYLPIERGYTNWDAISANLEDHPINEGVTSFSSLIHISSIAVQDEGLPLGTYQNGYLTGAYHASKPVVALNIFPVDGFWGGDILLLMGNTFDYLGGSIRWMKPSVKDLVIPGGRTVKLGLDFNTEEMAAGQYQALLSLEHNAPAGPQPLEVPVTLKVRSKRCLAVEPMALDFGDTWKEARSTRSFALVNRCNEPTTVEGIRSGDDAFAVEAALPLEVAPFSSVPLEAAFSPKDLRVHRAHLEIVSNSQDAHCLFLTLRGQGIRPPAISVNPASYDVSIKAGEVVSRILTVKNSGGDTLAVSITSATAEGPADGPGPGDSIPRKPVLTPGKSALPSGIWSSTMGVGAVASFQPLAADPAVKASGLRVLYYTTVLPSGFEDSFVRGLRGLPGLGSLEILNGEFSTPNADYLLGYDAVIVSSLFPFADAESAGNALAEYVDRGGRVCLMAATNSLFKGQGLGGRIATPDYMPLAMATPGMGGRVTLFEDHPINQGIQDLFSGMPVASASTQGDGQSLGSLESGYLLGAWSTRKAVVALNVFPADWGWKGDLIPMMGNVLEHLSGFGSFVGVQPRNLTVAPGASAEALVTFDGGKAGGGVNLARLSLSHNAPGQGDVVIPVTLTVAGSRSLSISSASLDFGGVLLGNDLARELILSNTGNLPVTVGMIKTGSADFTVVGASFPVDLAAGERVRFDAIFAPAAHGDAAGALEFGADGAGAPLRTELAGRGLRPAELRATANPSPLRFTVVQGGQASGSLNLANLGDEGLFYKVDLLAAPVAGTDAAASAVSDASAVAAASAVYGPQHHAPLDKGALDTRVGRPVDLSSGGPDRFGHRWSDSKEEGGPAFAWTDISGTGRVLETVSGCDDCSEEVNLSFLFPFYAASGYPSLFVGSNGYVTFGQGSGAFSNHPLPSPSMPGNLVAALFQDLYPRGGGSILFQDFGDRAVVQYQDVPDFHGTGTYDFQIVLRADGTVDLLYKRLGGVRNTATVGIQSGEAVDGLGVVYNSDYLEDGLAVRMRTWMTVPSRFGSLDGQAGKTLPVSLDSRGLAPGTHVGALDISSGGSRPGGRVEIPVEITVTPAPGSASR